MKYQIIETMGYERSFQGVTFHDSRESLMNRLNYIVNTIEDGKEYIQDNVYIYDLESGKRIDVEV